MLKDAEMARKSAGSLDHGHMVMFLLFAGADGEAVPHSLRALFAASCDQADITQERDHTEAIACHENHLSLM